MVINKNKEEDTGNASNVKTTNHTPLSLIAVVPKRQGDSVSEVAHSEEITDKTEITDELPLTLTSTEGLENINKQRDTETEKEQEHGDMQDSASNPIEVADSEDKNECSVNTTHTEKPSAIVVESENAKYAVIW
jgi:hypothetical protein